MQVIRPFANAAGNGFINMPDTRVMLGPIHAVLALISGTIMSIGAFCTSLAPGYLQQRRQARLQAIDKRVDNALKDFDSIVDFRRPKISYTDPTVLTDDSRNGNPEMNIQYS